MAGGEDPAASGGSAQDLTAMPQGQARETSEDGGIGEAYGFIMHCSGTAARNTVNRILEGYEVRKGRIDPERLVEWLADSTAEGYQSLSSVEAPEGDGFIATRFKAAAIGASLAAGSFRKAASRIREFFILEPEAEKREKFILTRLREILEEWEGRDIDEWASRNAGPGPTGLILRHMEHLQKCPADPHGIPGPQDGSAGQAALAPGGRAGRAASPGA